MPLLPGTKLGVYEIVASIGAGGMGEVYRAHDARLRRDVALKVLPEKSSADRDAIARFHTEAQAASALNHPHILTIYDIGQAPIDGVPRDFIAMEYIEGETLRDRFARQPDLDGIVDLLIQIGEGLAKAHEASIVHRDLKPDNIMVTSDGYVKILDFGLARLIEDDSSPSAPTIAQSAAGAIVGTIGYVSPEQVRGEEIDQRSDIFSFGCIAWEAIARQRAFRGHTPLETLHQIAEVELPPLPNATAELQRIVSRCLAKQPRDRYASMRDVVAELRRTRERRQTPKLLRLMQVTFDRAVEQFPVISADGNRVAFTREVGNVRKLFLTTIGEGGDEPVTDGGHDDTQPFWSPQGEALLFVRGEQADVRLDHADVYGRWYGDCAVCRLDLATRKISPLIANAYNPAWSPDGKRIAFDASWSGARRIWISDERGRNPEQLTTDHSDAAMHLRPRWSPDGRHIVFQNCEGTKYDIRAVDIETKRMTWVTNDVVIDLHPVWSPDGESILMSSYRAGGINIWRVPVARDGTPIGAMEQVTAGAGQDLDLDVALSSGRIVFATLKQNADLWRLPVDSATGAATGPPQAVIEATRENSRGAWSPDGETIAFNSDRAGSMNLWLYTTRDGKTHPLTRGEGGDYQANWSPDGKAIAFFSTRAGTTDIWRVDVATGALAQLTHGEGMNINPFFSPDGSRIAFISDRDGRLEVWVMNADGSGPRALTDVGVGGHFLRWSRDGSRIFFRCPTAPTPQTMTVPAAGGDPEPTATVTGGSHLSLSPDESMIMDVVGHRTLWVSPLNAGEPRRVFEFDDPESRIDYPVWSPDGRWILFDRFVPRGGDVWMLQE